MNNRMIIYVASLIVALAIIPILVIPMTSNEHPVTILTSQSGSVKLVKWYFTPKGGHPGDPITVRGYIYNGMDVPVKLYAESGIASHGWKSFSIYGKPIQVPIEGGPCCPENKNYDGGYFTVQPHQYVYIELHPQLPTQSSIDHCNNLGSFWNGANKDYDIAFIVVKPVNGDACWHSPTQHGQTLYSLRSIIYVGNGGFNFMGYYLDDTKVFALVLLFVGLIASSTILLYPRRW